MWGEFTTSPAAVYAIRSKAVAMSWTTADLRWQWLTHCQEYLYDHRNESLRDFIVNTIVGGPDAMENPSVDGIFLDVRHVEYRCTLRVVAIT